MSGQEFSVDYLRLACLLDLIIDIDSGEHLTTIEYTVAGEELSLSEGHGSDPYITTCRAIARAAAEIASGQASA